MDGIDDSWLVSQVCDDLSYLHVEQFDNKINELVKFFKVALTL